MYYKITPTSNILKLHRDAYITRYPHAASAIKAIEKSIIHSNESDEKYQHRLVELKTESSSRFIVCVEFVCDSGGGVNEFIITKHNDFHEVAGGENND